jgi:very-short-patch-repair endonuclease
VTADLDRRVEELASTQLGLFAVRQVLLLGGTKAAVDYRRMIGRWQSRGRGVLALLGTPESYDRKVLAIILASRCSAYASHRSAARRSGLPGFGEMLEILTCDGARVRFARVKQHRSTLIPASHVMIRDGIPMTTVARTLFDLSAVVRPGRVARALDTALARRMVTLAEISRVARDLSGRGRRKVTVIRAILAERGMDFVAPETDLEQEFVALIAGSDLLQPARQVNLGDQLAWIGRVDFVYRDARVVIETDGKEHHSSLLDRQWDAARDAALTAAGWTVMRFSWFDIVHRPRQTLSRIRRHVGAVAA